MDDYSQSDWTVERSEFKGHPMLQFNMSTPNYPDNKPWGFGVAKGVKLLKDIRELVSFVQEHGKPEDIASLGQLFHCLSFMDHAEPGKPATIDQASDYYHAAGPGVKPVLGNPEPAVEPTSPADSLPPNPALAEPRTDPVTGEVIPPGEDCPF